LTGDRTKRSDLINDLCTLYGARRFVIEYRRDEANTACGWHCDTRVDDGSAFLW
jgi:hypothetical protein